MPLSRNTPSDRPSSVQRVDQQDVDLVGGMRMDLIDLSHRLPKDDTGEWPRLWNAAFDALVALQKQMEKMR